MVGVTSIISVLLWTSVGLSVGPRSTWRPSTILRSGPSAFLEVMRNILHVALVRVAFGVPAHVTIWIVIVHVLATVAGPLRRHHPSMWMGHAIVAHASSWAFVGRGP